MACKDCLQSISANFYARRAGGAFFHIIRGIFIINFVEVGWQPGQMDPVTQLRVLRLHVLKIRLILFFSNLHPI